jgi:hypothetical protein
MLSSGEWLPDEKGGYFIDRGSEGFERILDYLSTGELFYKGLNQYERKVLRDNLDYFQIIPALPPLLWSLESVINVPSGLRLSNDNKSVRVSGKTYGTIHTNISADRFQVRISEVCGVVGFASTIPCNYTDPVTGKLYTDVQLFGFNTGNGRLNVLTSTNSWGHVSKSFVQAEPNSIITATYDRVKHEIRFEVDDHDIGLCFGDIKIDQMFPAASLIYDNLVVTLLG